MKTTGYKIVALGMGLLCLLATSCSKDSASPLNEEAKQEQTQEKSIQIGFGAEQVEFQEDAEYARALGYTFGTDEFKLPKITFGAAGDTNDVPVMAFFRNKTTNQMVHVKLMFNTVKGSNKLYRTFSAIPELNSYVNQSNWNDWYVKMFIGGYPEKIGVGGNWPAHSTANETDPTINQVRFVFDSLWDVTPGTTQVTIGEYLSGKWDGFPVRPLPMETDWTHVRFTSPTGGNPSYTSNNVVFKPIGSLLRILFENKASTPASFSSVALYNVQGNPSRSVNDAMLVNHILVKLDQNLAFAADGSVDQAASVTRQEVTDGYIHYHFPDVNRNRTVKEVAPGGKRLLYLWVLPTPSRPKKTSEIIQPSLYKSAANNHQYDGTTFYRRASGLTVTRDTYQEGKSYTIRMTRN